MWQELDSETGLQKQIFLNWDQLRIWLIQNHNIPRLENSKDLPEILSNLNIIDYIQPQEEIDQTPYVPYVPFEVSMRQCQTYLYQMPLINGRNVLDIIEQDVVPSLSKLAQIEWKTNPPVWRSSPMVEQMRVMFGWTIEQMNQMFIDAEKL